MAFTREIRNAVIIAAFGLFGIAQTAQPQAPPPPGLVLEQVIALPDVNGRIDHLAVDPVHHRLFVAELGNGSVEAIDLISARVMARISGLKDPQGLAYVADRDELVVASGDGRVGFYHADGLSLVGQLKLGDDADNVRVDPSTGSVIVGYGGGALAVISAATRQVTSTITLPAHPESFRLGGGRRLFINLPNAGKIAVVDLKTMKVVAMRSAGHGANFPLLVDDASNSLVVVYRLPARLVITNAEDGAVRQDLDVCGDSDDLYLDKKRHRIYVSCGSGDIDVLDASPNGYQRTFRIKSRPGARTSLFVPEFDRLYVAARAEIGNPAAILVYQPSPMG